MAFSRRAPDLTNYRPEETSVNLAESLVLREGSRDQSIFNGGCTLFVTQELGKLLHWYSLPEIEITISN